MRFGDVAEPWQRALVIALFGHTHNGKRIIRRCYLKLARKGGKTLLASVIALTALLLEQVAGRKCYA